MGLFSKKPNVDTQELEERLAAVTPWQRDDLSVNARIVRTGLRRKGTEVGVDVRAGQSHGVFVAEELLAVFQGFTLIAETFVDSPELLFLCRQDAGARGSSAADSFANLPEGAYVLAGAGDPMPVLAVLTSAEAPSLEAWLRSLPGITGPLGG